MYMGFCAAAALLAFFIDLSDINTPITDLTVSSQDSISIACMALHQIRLPGPWDDPEVLTCMIVLWPDLTPYP